MYFNAYAGIEDAMLIEKQRTTAEKEDQDMVARLMKGNATQLEIELALLRAREVRALERKSR